MSDDEPTPATPSGDGAPEGGEQVPAPEPLPTRPDPMLLKPVQAGREPRLIRSEKATKR